MKKNSIDNSSLCNRNFVLACTANFLLYASVYAVLVYGVFRLDACIYPMFILGMLAVGPFHAWLADKFRRKHVMAYPFIGIALTTVGYAYASLPVEWGILAVVQGACFGLSVSAGITVSIDVVHTGHRTAANRVFAFWGRLGMLFGLLGVGGWLGALAHYNFFVALPAVMSLLGGLAASLVYLPFRAPIGLSVCSLDRYWLKRAWLPALNVGLLGFGIGAVVISIQASSDVFGVLFCYLPWLILLPFVPGLVQMFVKLSHHCQRATGNMTYNLSLDLGILLGFWCSTYHILSLGLLAFLLVVAVLMFATVTRIYYTKMRVR